MANDKTVLLVDDLKESYILLKQQLKNESFNIVYESNPANVLNVLDSNAIDVILMDVVMPGANGFELTKTIREHLDSKYVPIIIYTSHDEPDNIVRGLEVGADDYIVKPCNQKILSAKLNSHIRRNKVSSDTDVSMQVSYDEHNKELQKKIYYLNNLFEISRELHSALDLDKLINTALIALIGHLSAKSATLLFSSVEDEKTVYPISSKGLLESDTREMKFSRKGPLFKYFKDHNSPKLVSELDKIPALKMDLDKVKKTGVVLIAPVKTEDFIEGFILLGKRLKNQEYNLGELDIIKMFSNMLAVALGNAASYEKIKELSYTDGMTKLHNYRYFELRLAEEMARCRRLNNGLGLIIMDVDHFKNYNDTLGHPAGDECLRIFARVVKDTARNVDVVCRYGGEEFAVILPNVDIPGAEIFANRIREKIEETKFPNEDIQPKGRLTASVGVSMFPDNAKNEKDLVTCADKALYQAKEGGRNRFIMYSGKAAKETI